MLENKYSIGHYCIGNNNILGDIIVCELSLPDYIAKNLHRILGKNRNNSKKHFLLFNGKQNIFDVFDDGNYNLWESNFQEKNRIDVPNNINSCIKTLKEQKILLITGNYGHGKTMLSKQIQIKCIESGGITLFFRARDLIEILKEKIFKEIFISLSNNLSKDVYIFIDAIDELNYDNLMKCLIDEVLTCIAEQNNIYFVINSRIYLRIKENMSLEIIEVEDFFAEECFDILERTCFRYVKIENFNNKQINRLFKKLNTTTELEKDLTTETIKKYYKYLINACKIPLFAYIIGSYYYENDFKLPQNILEIYNYFVSETIKGKFCLESTNSVNIKNYETEYENLLKVLAVSMLAASPQSIDYKGNEELFIFDDNIFSFCIKLSKLSSEAEKIFKKYNQYYYLSNLKEYRNADFLNCYFFNVYSNSNDEIVFTFSDQNTMCYLASKYAFEKINYFTKETYIITEKTKEFTAILEFLNNFQLHAISIDFLIENLRMVLHKDKIKKNHLIENLKQILTILDNNNYNTHIYSDKILAQIIIRIIFIKFFNGSYSSIEDNHFFKSFDILCKNAKAMKLNGTHTPELEKHRYLIERYFMHCTFNDACFRRINLKFYNFQGSIISNCIFEQCKFYKTNLADTKIEGNVKFSLCYFNKVNFEFEIKSNLKIQDTTFLNCEVNDVLAENNVIIFENCRIANLNIRSNKNKKRLRILFKNCNIKNIGVFGYKLTIGMTDCLFNNEDKIKIKSWSDVVIYSNNDSYKVNYNIDINSKCRYMQQDDIQEEKTKGIDWKNL